jgi:rhamnogalacturonan endolyase
MRNLTYTLSCLFMLVSSFTGQAGAQRQMEYLGRGVVAIPQGKDSVFISWRLLGTDPENITFNLYKKTGKSDPVKLNGAPLDQGTNYVDTKADLSQSNSYFVESVIKGKESEGSSPFTLPANSPVRQYMSIPLQTPEGYTPNDASVGDLDGDGEYEIIIHQVGRGRDNGAPGVTTPPILEAYKMDGTFLWRINLGRNIREGAHYTQFMVYDLDGDGRAEVACKTADGTIDGKGAVIGDSTADHRNSAGHIYKGPEYLTIFDGLTGAALATTKYIPGRYPSSENPTPEEMKTVWGDNHYNRSERYLACIAYLDGKHPSLVMCRGYYTRVTLTAWNWRGGKLSHLWTFDSDDKTPGNEKFHGQGNHNLSVGDVDGDGKDEIMYGSAAIDDNGKGLYSTGLGHADAMHFSDLDPDHPGLEVFNIQERFDDAGMNFRDAGTGKILWKLPSVKAAESGGDKGEGPARGMAENIDPRYRGAECWAFGAGMKGFYNCKGEKISDKTPRSCNFAVYWDGDLLRELLDKNTILKWNWKKDSLEVMLRAEGCMSNNGTKSTPVLSADLFGDWREEVIWRTEDNKELRIYSTTIPTQHRIYTLMHDPIYRLGIAWQNVAYNQPPHLSFYMGDDMAKPPKPFIYVLKPKNMQHK